MEIHQRQKAGPDCHRLTTMVKRSIDQNLRMKIFETRSGNFETSAVVKNQRTKQREQIIVRDCWQWKTKRQCSKRDSCSFRHDTKKRAKSNTAESSSEIFYATESERNASRTRSHRVPVVECLDGLARITSKELAITHFVENGTLQNACSTRPRAVQKE